MTESRKTGVVLNIVPVLFSKEKTKIGRIPYEDEKVYAKLREDYWQTHAFRYDSRTKDILNVSLSAQNDVLGEPDDVEMEKHLLLIAKAIQQSILIRIAKTLPILKAGKKLIFWGKTDSSLLLTQAVQKSGSQIVPGLEVAIKYEIDCRMFWDASDKPYLGLVVEMDTSNIIDIPVSVLQDKGLIAVDKYVCSKQNADQPYLRPRLKLLGRVIKIDGSTLLLTDTNGITEIHASEAFLEPRNENLKEAIKICYGAKAASILTNLNSLRQYLTAALGKLERIQNTLAILKKCEIKLSNDVEITFGDLLNESNPLFPIKVATDRPTMLFGAQGRNTGQYPDLGITNYGPYMYMQHARNAPVIAVLCEARFRGRMEQFLKSLKEGFPQELWTNSKNQNPFKDGLIGKFRLSKIRFVIEECNSSTASDYKNSIRKILQQLPETPDLAIVQTRESFKQLHGDENPYYVAKSECMKAGIPTQSISIEKIESAGSQIAYILNNVALASYAKLDGIPWVISTRGTTAHELVVGLSSAEVASGRLQSKARYVGITTVFQGDGRYLVWEMTREVKFENYSTALLESLRTTITYVQERNGWQPGDKIRLVCHVYKRLKDCEVNAIKSLVQELVRSQYSVEFAFLDISWSHPFQIFDPMQKGKSYWSEGATRMKGRGIPARGICFQLDKSRGLLNLTGPSDVKTECQGLPKPLLVELHSESDFTDMTYLLRQAYYFSYMSWRSFFPATEPITIKYSRLIASLLGNLKPVTGWDSTVLSVGTLRGRYWFL